MPHAPSAFPTVRADSTTAASSRDVWPDTWGSLRSVNHIAEPAGQTWMEAQPHLSYATGLTSNTVWQKLAHKVVEPAKRVSACLGRTAPRVHATCSQAGTWSRLRRVVIKVEWPHQASTRAVS